MTEEKEKFQGPFNEEECMETMEAIIEAPGDILGNTKDETIQFIKDNIDDYNTMIVLVSCLVAGVSTLRGLKESMSKGSANDATINHRRSS